MVASTSPLLPRPPPPELPPLPGAPQALPDYLRRFSLWCRNGFLDRFSLQSSTPHVYMTSAERQCLQVFGQRFRTSAFDGDNAWVRQGDDAVITFSPVTTANSVTRARGGAQATSGSSYHMVGLALCLYPAGSRAQAIAVAVGGISNTVANGETDAVICFGTGTAPITGAALAGTIIGSAATFVAPTAGASGSFSASGIGSPLWPRRAYWFDIAIRGIGGAGRSAIIA